MKSRKGTGLGGTIVKASLEHELSELTDAEDFLDYFGIVYDPQVVEVSRLHILQRFHDYLQSADRAQYESEASKRGVYRELLKQAYEDFVKSSPGAEKVFEVFHRHRRRRVFVPVEALLK